MRFLSGGSFKQSVTLGVLWMFTVSFMRAQQVERLRVDASQSFVVPPSTTFRGGASVSPIGGTLGLNARYLTLKGEPWLPIMGEFQFSRYPKAQWEEEILKMKAGGVNIIGFYMFWIHHEEIEGQFDWTGDRDVRHFVELCAKYGMLAYPRIGPWAHGEARNGGFPDWLLTRIPKEKLKSTDPVYLNAVARYFAEMGTQLHGLMWKDGGPIVGIQIENEYSNRDDAAGQAYILSLKKLAIQAGFDVPYYTVTGWGHAVVPPGQVMPVYGAYPESPWDFALGNLPPSGSYNFNIRNKGDGNMGMIAKDPGKNIEPPASQGTPYMTVEMGGGVQDTYHRRPTISAEDVSALMPVALGGGVNLYGTYIFQGAQNPDGKLSTMQESRATGYATDVPVKSYDFQAPLSEFGEERESFRQVKLFNYFANDFGRELAPMIPHLPDVVPKELSDLKTLRFVVRTQDQHGFLFANNYVRGYRTADYAAVQFLVDLPKSKLSIPAEPLNVPSGTYFIWPFNMDMDGVNLHYSTAQLFTRLSTDTESIYIFFAPKGIRSDFAFEQQSDVEINVATSPASHRGGGLYFKDVQPHTSMTLRKKGGKQVRIILLTQHEAENTWKVRIDETQHLLMTESAFYASRDRLFLQSQGDPEFHFELLPPGSNDLRSDVSLSSKPGALGGTLYSARVPERHIVFSYKPIQGAQPSSAPPRLPPPGGKASIPEAPSDEQFKGAAKWALTFAPDSLRGLNDIFVHFNYLGDVARLSDHGHLLADDFYDGKIWNVGLKRYLAKGQVPEVDLSILPLNHDAPIFLEDWVRKALPQIPQMLELRSITVIPEYQLQVATGNGRR